MPADAKSLQDRLQELKEALRHLESGTASLSAPPPTPAALPIAGLSLEDRIARLMEEVRAKCSLAIGPTLKNSLLNALRSSEPQAMGQWVERLCSVSASHPEWQAFVESLTNHETYFFRDPGQMEFIAQTVIAPAVASEREKVSPTFRVWSAASSSGEEVYTVAMMILEALHQAGETLPTPDGFFVPHPRWRIEVLGTDISRAILQRAMDGVYEDFGLGSFRGMPARYWRFLTPHQSEGEAGRLFRVRPEVRAITRFESFNLMEPEPPGRDFNLVLCRNVLIYFDAPARDRVCGLLYKALRRDGHLALGPTDNVRTAELFKPLWGPSTILYQKR